MDDPTRGVVRSRVNGVGVRAYPISRRTGLGDRAEVAVDHLGDAARDTDGFLDERVGCRASRSSSVQRIG